MQKNHLGMMTWPEVKLAAERNLPVLIPMGTVEAQGLHSPMGHDYIVAERVAAAVAEREECLVCPTIPFGYSHFSKPFTGTISLRPETVRMLLEDVSGELVRHGFRHLVFLNNHGLNEPILGHVADALREEHGISVASLFPYKIALELGRDQYPNQEGLFAHGGEPTVSLLMYLTPDAMRMDGAQRRSLAASWRGFEVAGPGQVRMGDTTATVYMDFTELAPTGGSGDPTVASAEKGRILFGRVVDWVAAFVARFRQEGA